MTQMPPLLTAEEVAEVFQTSADAVRRWGRAGKLPAIKLPSGRMRFRREDVEKLLDAPTNPEPVSA